MLDAIEAQLIHSPRSVTRNRKPLRENDLSQWEMRVRHYRIFYDLPGEQTVLVKAVGWKEHNALYIRGKEYPL